MAEIDPNILKSIERKIRVELFTMLPLIVLSIGIPLCAWHGFLQYDENVSVWFQRSGSLTVLFAVWAEYKLFRIQSLSNPISSSGVTFRDLAHRDFLKTKYQKPLSIIKYLNVLLAISGTVIWGYGDIFRTL